MKVEIAMSLFGAIPHLLLGLVTFLVFALILFIGGAETDSPKTPKPTSYCSMFHYLAGVLFAKLSHLSAIQFALLHLSFEIFENSSLGQRFWQNRNQTLLQPLFWINNLIGIDLLGRSYHGDSTVNSNMDTLLAITGFITARTS